MGFIHYSPPLPPLVLVREDSRIGCTRDHRYQEAMQLLSKYSAAYARINQMHKVYTLGLAIVIVALHTGDVKRARGEYQEFCDKFRES